jgi:hypothetical protein
MVLEFLISTSKLIVVFICIALFVLSLVFKTMSGAMYYYYKRDIDLVGIGSAVKDPLTVSKKFRPVFRNVNMVSMGDKLAVITSFSKSTKFKRILPDGKFRYGGGL